MTPTFETTGHVARGQLKIRHRRELEAWAKRLRDCEIVVTIARKHATRSLHQNAYYWSVVVHLLSEHTGYTPDEIHEFLKMKFLPKKLAVTDRNGVIQDEYVIGGTTTRLNKVEFGEYILSIQQWAAETLDIDVPNPNEEQGAA